MLLLSNARTITVDGITVFPDHADTNQFWYLPAPVNLMRRGQDQSAQFTLILYKPSAVTAGAKGGGFLMFEAGLRVDRAAEQKILSRLSSIARKPRLTAVSFDEGNVQCIALNVQGGGGTSAGNVPEGSFNAVEKILGASVPSLHGDNSAAFSLQLSQEGATILREAFQKEGAPVGVLYNLKFTGIRPALEVRITADMKRVYDHFSASLSGQVYFLQLGIDAGIEKLKQSGALKIEVLHFTSDADRGEKEKQAIQFFRDTLLKDFFTPTLTPGQLMGGGTPPGGGATPPGGGATPPGGGATPPGGGATPPGGGATPPGGGATPPGGGATPPGGGATPPGGGATPPGGGGTPPGGQTPPGTGASPISISFKLKFIKQEELRVATYHYKSQEAIQRTYNPQGFVGLLTQDLDKSKHFIEVDLDNPFFRQMAVTVDAPIDFAKIGLHSAQVALDYGNPADPTNHRHRDIVFDKAHGEEQKWEFFLNSKFDTQFFSLVEYHFDPASGWDGEKSSYEMPPKKSEDRTLYINPFEHFRFQEYTVAARGIDFGVVDLTEVTLRYQATTGWKKEKTLTLVSNAVEPLVWKLRTPAEAEAPTIFYKCRHHLKDGSFRDSQELSTKQSAILVDDPFPDALELTFFPFLDSSSVRKAIIDVEYKDQDNKYERKERLEIPGTATDEVRLRIAIIDPSKRKFKYKVTLVKPSGIKQMPPVETQETLLSISEA